jgi:hypothetical protein
MNAGGKLMAEDSNNMVGDADASGVNQPLGGKKAKYEIGYRKPPKATQFKKGQSGNPKGAKKKAEIDDIRLMIEDVLAEPITLRDGERTMTVSKLEAVFRAHRLNALKGDQKAAKALFKLAQKANLFSKAKPRSNVIIDPPGSSPEERMLIRAYAEREVLHRSGNASSRLSANKSEGPDHGSK